MAGSRTEHRARLSRSLALAAAGTLALMAAPAAAQSLGDRFWIEGQAYFPSADTSASISQPGLPGTDIDFENDLGMDASKVVPAVNAGARFGRFVFTGEYYALSREGSRTLTRDIDFDGVTYPASVSIDSKFSSNVYRATVGYAFILNDRAELGVAIGLHATDFEVALEGQGTVGGSTVLSSQVRRRTFLAPMPTVGVFGAVKLGERFTLSGRADYLSLSIGDYDGSIINAQAAIGYHVTDNVQVGAGWRYVAYDFGVDKPEYTADVNYNFSGPTVFVRVGFN